MNEGSKDVIRQHKQKLPGVLLRVGSELFAGVAAGVTIGVLLDKHYLTSPIWTITFFFLGCAAGFLNVFRVIKDNRNQF